VRGERKCTLIISKVKIIEEPRITIAIEKKAAIIGTESEVGGVISATFFENIFLFLLFLLKYHSKKNCYRKKICCF